MGRSSKAIWCTVGLALAISNVEAQTANTITAAPATLTFQYQLGAMALPAVQTLQVTSVPTAMRLSRLRLPALHSTRLGYYFPRPQESLQRRSKCK